MFNIDIRPARKKLSEICKANSFKRRGNAHFRVVGDGVLQIVKFEYEGVFSHYNLNFGLFSMYSKLAEQHFTSSGCIPQYYVFALQGRKDAVKLNGINSYYSLQIDSPEQQVQYFQDTVLGWLDTIDTQQKLIDAVCYIEKQIYSDIDWLDSFKIETFLCAQMYDRADYVINSILHQHLGSNIWRELPWTHQDYQLYAQKFPGKDERFLELHNWIFERNDKAISHYLQSNFANNRLWFPY